MRRPSHRTSRSTGIVESRCGKIACGNTDGYRPQVASLDQLTPGTSVKGLLPDCLVTVVSVRWFGSEALELTYKDPAGSSAISSSTATMSRPSKSPR